MCTDRDGVSLQVETSGSILSIPAGTLAATVDSGSPYIFTVSVHDVVGRKESDSIAVSVTVLAEHHITVDISVLSDVYYRGSDELVNSDGRIVLEAVCGSESDALVQWNIAPLSDASEALTKGVDGGLLVIPQGAGILAPGLTYTISVKCSAEQLSGTGSLTVNVNEPPAGGWCQVCVFRS